MYILHCSPLNGTWDFDWTTPPIKGQGSSLLQNCPFYGKDLVFI